VILEKLAGLIERDFVHGHPVPRHRRLSPVSPRRVIPLVDQAQANWYGVALLQLLRFDSLVETAEPDSERQRPEVVADQDDVSHLQGDVRAAPRLDEHLYQDSSQTNKKRRPCGAGRQGYRFRPKMFLSRTILWQSTQSRRQSGPHGVEHRPARWQHTQSAPRATIDQSLSVHEYLELAVVAMNHFDIDS